MGGVDYDWLEGMQRVMRAEVKLDEHWVEIISLHAALETEIDAMLVLSLPCGEAVTSNRPRITFGHKVAILKAAWKGEREEAEKLCAILLTFNELRNAVAHPEMKKTAAEVAKLTAAYKALVPDMGHEPTVAEIAQGAVAFMGDGILPHELEEIVGKLDHLVHDEMPAALGRRPTATEVGDASKK
ncbi:hypothetical protein [Sphingomonas hengshuiensis]|uniref:Uncharacterized protein n=1 Tax=Sphingomonas hengshuiensis TaxID=1609977 RepID=A0A7U4J6U4_9SPHN|nr:hypothetical protein [Sphingomonas hengshuiensis]AJP71320.1 hypothetical protein TS85_05290 [Sphingomonas hengshuiensis]